MAIDNTQHIEKLIPMTEFVLKHQSNILTNNKDKIMDSAHAMLDYAEFLRQPLKLWQFVPCDQQGEILKKPNLVYYADSEEVASICIDVVNEYFYAQLNVLFKDVSVEKAQWTKDNIYELSDYSGRPFLCYDNVKKHFYDAEVSENYIITSIEQLISYADLTLTQKAKQIIYGNN